MAKRLTLTVTLLSSDSAVAAVRAGRGTPFLDEACDFVSLGRARGGILIAGPLDSAALDATSAPQPRFGPAWLACAYLASIAPELPVGKALLRCRALFPAVRLGSQPAAEAEAFAKDRLARGLAAALRAGATAAAVSMDAGEGDGNSSSSSSSPSLRAGGGSAAAEATRMNASRLRTIARREAEELAEEQPVHRAAALVELGGGEFVRVAWPIDERLSRLEGAAAPPPPPPGLGLERAREEEAERRKAAAIAEAKAKAEEEAAAASVAAAAAMEEARAKEAAKAASKAAYLEMKARKAEAKAARKSDASAAGANSACEAKEGGSNDGGGGGGAFSPASSSLQPPLPRSSPQDATKGCGAAPPARYQPPHLRAPGVAAGSATTSMYCMGCRVPRTGKFCCECGSRLQPSPAAVAPAEPTVSTASTMPPAPTKPTAPSTATGRPPVQQPARPSVLAAAPAAPDLATTSYRCKKCRVTLFTSSMLVAHEAGEGQEAFRWHKREQNKGGAAHGCTSHFLESELAVERKLLKPELAAELQGDLVCPKCAARYGYFNWSGAQCSCGAWVAPAIQVTKSKVDESGGAVAAPVLMGARLPGIRGVRP